MPVGSSTEGFGCCPTSEGANGGPHHLVSQPVQFACWISTPTVGLSSSAATTSSAKNVSAGGCWSATASGRLAVPSVGRRSS
eukprot:CAMPEP_0204282522 /NCGR_PEP_ID=MMETSP0468-20130131/43753_1 /ASSEMBLY_ACC=CAM_ASM_000383 /TAXON_ID=2969 /ORGANISM="Oxyrrhis marina" /LENGTH=81 /DNA_ID=CAMNT_0051260033 /DNA_START=88 /DNA_END=329 /DNA_ORIENTATION=+